MCVESVVTLGLAFQPDSLSNELHVPTAFPTFFEILEAGMYIVGFK